MSGKYYLVQLNDEPTLYTLTEDDYYTFSIIALSIDFQLERMFKTRGGKGKGDSTQLDKKAEEDRLAKKAEQDTSKMSCKFFKKIVSSKKVVIGLISILFLVISFMTLEDREGQLAEVSDDNEYNFVLQDITRSIQRYTYNQVANVGNYAYDKGAAVGNYAYDKGAAVGNYAYDKAAAAANTGLDVTKYAYDNRFTNYAYNNVGKPFFADTLESGVEYYYHNPDKLPKELKPFNGWTKNTPFTTRSDTKSFIYKKLILTILEKTRQDVTFVPEDENLKVYIQEIEDIGLGLRGRINLMLDFIAYNNNNGRTESNINYYITSLSTLLGMVSKSDVDPEATKVAMQLLTQVLVGRGNFLHLCSTLGNLIAFITILQGITKLKKKSITDLSMLSVMMLHCLYQMTLNFVLFSSMDIGLSGYLSYQEDYKLLSKNLVYFPSLNNDYGDVIYDAVVNAFVGVLVSSGLVSKSLQELYFKALRHKNKATGVFLTLLSQNPLNCNFNVRDHFSTLVENLVTGKYLEDGGEEALSKDVKAINDANNNSNPLLTGVDLAKSHGLPSTLINLTGRITSFFGQNQQSAIQDEQQSAIQNNQQFALQNNRLGMQVQLDKFNIDKPLLEAYRNLLLQYYQKEKVESLQPVTINGLVKIADSYLKETPFEYIRAIDMYIKFNMYFLNGKTKDYIADIVASMIAAYDKNDPTRTQFDKTPDDVINTYYEESVIE
jgi:hypothetical protein